MFVCNPNNPTGAVFDPDALMALAERHPATLFVIDEAYLPFAAGIRSALDFQAENVLVLRSLTKDCGLAGLRLGYAVGPEPIVEALRRAQPPWSVNAAAQAAGVAALGASAREALSLSALLRVQTGLRTALTTIGLHPLPSAAPFFLLRVGDGAASFGIAHRSACPNTSASARAGRKRTSACWPPSGGCCNHACPRADDPGDQLVGRQEPADRRPVPHLCAARCASGAVQGAKHVE
jgi:hypothetical protein